MLTYDRAYCGCGYCNGHDPKAEYIVLLAKKSKDFQDIIDTLETMVNEPDEFDGHDGRCGHITYATIAQARAILERVKKQYVNS